MASMRPPCDEAVIRSVDAGSPCRAEARGWILAATILGSSMAFIDSTVVNVALPALQASFQATVVDVQWVVEVYGLFLAALILVGGSLGDLLARRLIFIVGVAVFALASAGCGVASNIQQLIFARGIQGVGAALLVPGSLAIISTSFDEQSRGQAIGTWSGFTAITTAVGPVLGGWLVEHASWRWVFFINLPFAAAVIAISLWHFLLLVSVEPDPSSGIFRNRRRRRCAATDSSDLLTLPLVRRPRDALRPKTSADHRPTGGRVRFCAVRCTLRRWQLLEDVLSC